MRELSKKHAERDRAEETDASGLTKKERAELQAKKAEIRRLEAFVQMHDRRQASKRGSVRS